MKDQDQKNTPIATYDIYNKGICTATLEINTQTGMSAIRKLDVFTRKWEEPIIAAAGEVEASRAFQLWGGLRSLPSKIKDIEAAGWGNNRAIGWPDENNIYIRHHAMTEPVDGKTVHASLWVLKDGASIPEGMAFLGPMDLIISADNRLIAAGDMTLDLWLVRRGYENFTIVKQWSQPGISPAKYGVRFLGKFTVTEVDGLKLATVVYLPDDGKTDGKYPVILIRSPYGIKDVINFVGHLVESWHYCARGYAVVHQAVRGTTWGDPPEYRSEGIWEFCANEPKDGAECLKWVADQPWCNGNIGMAGISYLAVTQWTAAMSGNPSLKCIIPECIASVGSGTIPNVQPGGIFYALGVMRQDKKKEMTWDEIFKHRPIIDIDKFASGIELPMWRIWSLRYKYDEYWAQRDWYRSDLNINVAALHIDGWYNGGALPSRRNWELMKKNKNKNQRLIIGPWKHFRNMDRQLNGFNFGPDSIRDDLWLIKQKWYDRFLKGIENGVEKPEVQYYVMGEDKWHSAGQWPLPAVKHEKWYLHSTGKASELLADGTLSTASPAIGEPPDNYLYDPGDPAPNWLRFDRVLRFEGDIQLFPYNYKDIDARHDIVTYTSPPLDRDLTIAGDVQAMLYASCDVKDTDWWVRLEDVDQKGDSMSLNLGNLRARFRKLDDTWFNVFGSNYEREELLSGDPKDIVRFEISMAGMARTFKKGHCVRIAIMNACDNFFFPNSNTGGNEAYATECIVGNMTLHHNEKYPSHLILPVIPGGETR